jgi:hypothetical protein
VEKLPSAESWLQGARLPIALVASADAMGWQ